MVLSMKIAILLLKALFAFFFLLTFGVFALSDTRWGSQTKQNPPFFSYPITSTSGREMYLAYCSGCHG